MTRAKILTIAAPILVLAILLFWYLHRAGNVRPASVQAIAAAQTNLVQAKQENQAVAFTLQTMAKRQVTIKQLANEVLAAPPPAVQPDETPAAEEAAEAPQELAQEALQQGADLQVAQEDTQKLEGTLEAQETLDKAVAVRLEDADRHRLTFKKGTVLIGVGFTLALGADYVFRHR